MPLVEVDQSELEAHRQLTGVITDILRNPKTRGDLLKLQKTVRPDVPIPELDAAAPVLEIVQQMQNELKAAKEEREAEKAEREKERRMQDLQSRWDRGRQGLKSSGYTEEGIQAVEKFMEEKGLVDHEIGAAAFERLMPAPDPIRSVGGNRFDMFQTDAQSDAHLKALMADPENDSALNALINDTLRAARGT